MSTVYVLLIQVNVNHSLICPGVYRRHEFTVNTHTSIEPIFDRLRTNAILVGDFNIDIKLKNVKAEAHISLLTTIALAFH